LQSRVVLGHGRSREAGQMKEDDEGIPFHTLLTAGMHRGGRILPEKRVAASLFWAAALLSLAAVLGRGDAGGGDQGEGRGAGGRLWVGRQGATVLQERRIEGRRRSWSRMDSGWQR
jgi:hypothetical protein